MTSYFQYTPSTYTPSLPSPSGRLDTTFSGGVGSVDYGRIPNKPMGEWPISTCKMTGGRGVAKQHLKRRRSKRHGKRHSKKTKRSRKHNKSRKAPRR
jgi:hypothetical protein